MEELASTGTKVLATMAAMDVCINADGKYTDNMAGTTRKVKKMMGGIGITISDLGNHLKDDFQDKVDGDQVTGDEPPPSKKQKVEEPEAANKKEKPITGKDKKEKSEKSRKSGQSESKAKKARR